MIAQPAAGSRQEPPGRTGRGGALGGISKLGSARRIKMSQIRLRRSRYEDR
jgi:hypothetical protein